MKLEDQVCSLELAKRLKKLGVKQESYFRWLCYNHSDTILLGTRKDMENGYGDYFISAPTVAELGEALLKFAYMWQINWTVIGIVLLPEETEQIGHRELYELRERMKRDLYYYDGYHYLSLPTTEANARAKCLIYLLENKLVKI